MDFGLSRLVANSKHRAALITLSLTLLGGLFLLVALAPLMLPIQIMNSVLSVPVAQGANATVDLEAGHYYLIWRTDAPTHPVIYSWHIELELTLVSGATYLASEYTWDETIECKATTKGVTCSNWGTFSFVDLDLPAGHFALRVTVLAFASNDGSPRPAAALHFNEPNLKQPGHRAVLAVILAFTAAPSVVFLATAGRRRRAELVRAAASSAAAPRVVPSEDEPTEDPRPPPSP